MNKYINVPLSRYDIKILANEIQGIDINKKKTLLPFTLGEIRQLLASNGYKLVEKRYIHPKQRCIHTYYLIELV